MRKYHQSSKQERIVHFGSTEEYKVYAELIKMKGITDNESSAISKLIDELLKRIYPERIRSQLIKSGLNELVEFRKCFDFSKYGGGANVQDKFISCVNTCIVDALVKASNEQLLKSLFDCLKENTSSNQQLLKEYVSKLLSAKILANNLHDQLNLALEWPLFIKVHELHKYALYYKLSEPLSEIWLSKYNKVISYFISLLNELASTNEVHLRSIKLFHANLTSTCKLFSYIKGLELFSSKVESMIANVDELDKLVNARMKEIEMFEVYCVNLFKFNDIMRKCKENIDFNRLERQICSLKARRNVDAILMLNEICESASFRELNLEQYEAKIVFFNDIDAEFMKTIEKIICKQFEILFLYFLKLKCR